MRRAALGRTLAATALACAGALANPLSTEEIGKLCANADGQAHCARLIEAEQMKRLPYLAQREGDTLLVRLYPAGEAKLEDRVTLSGGTTYALFDFVNEFNAVVLMVTQDEKLGFALLQRTTGRQTAIPVPPVPSPDRHRFATADFCREHCENRLVVWDVDREGVRRELAWNPDERWIDATVQWKSADVLAIEYTREGETTPRKIERRLADPGWTRVAR